MESWSTGARLRYGAWQSVGLGLLAGAAETAFVAGTSPGLGVHEVVLLGLAALASMGAVGGLAGLLAAPVLRREGPVHGNLAAQLGVVAFLLSGLHLWAWAATLAAQHRSGAAALVAVLPLPLAISVSWQARFFLARTARGTAPPVGFVPVAGSASALLILGAALFRPGLLPHAGTSPALPPVVLVTVEGLRHEDLGADTPRILSVGRSGANFTQAIAPSTASVPVHGAILTGLHPLRHRAVDDEHVLARGWTTVAERLADRGYATAMFPSSATVRGVGLDQGFRVVDDRLGGSGLDRLRVLGWLLGDGVLRRDADRTVDAFRTWLGAVGGRPSFAWIQLEHRAGGDPAALDAAVGRVLDAIAEAGLASRALVVVASATGVRPGAPEAGLGEPLVHVPLVMRAPGYRVVGQVDAQVRLVDVAPTLLEFAGVDRPEDMEGISLLGFLDGRRVQGTWTVLVGRGADGRPLLGVRQGEVKAVLDLEGDEVVLHDLAADPGETRDIAAEQTEAVRGVRSLLGPDAEALRALGKEPGLGRRRARVLHALGVRP